MSEPTRWTNATDQPDMWLDPDDDPRDNDSPGPEGEVATYREYLDNYRLTLIMKCDVLEPERLARRSVPPSTLSRGPAVPDAIFDGRDPGERIETGASIRELWVHRIEEYARHCGHADLLRECIDGRVGQ